MSRGSVFLLPVALLIFALAVLVPVSAPLIPWIRWSVFSLEIIRVLFGRWKVRGEMVRGPNAPILTAFCVCSTIPRLVVMASG